MNAEELALQKDFRALSANEKALVLAEMSEEEYAQLRKVLLATRQLDTDRLPPSRLRAELLASMSKKNRPNGIRHLISTPVPLWLSAAALITGIVAVSFLQKEHIVEKTVTAWQWRVDTVFLEKTLWRDRIVLKSKVIFREKTPNQPLTTVPLEINDPLGVPAFQTPEFSEPHVGTSLGDTPE